MNCGRIVIPMEIRRTLGIAEKDPLEIYVSEESIVLKKHEVSCVFCDNKKDLKNYKDKIVCSTCLNELLKLK